jgi:F-type H+-transporting ATPase subunit delta
MASTSSTAAKRYAKGLLQLVIERNEVDSLLTDMQMIRSTMDGSPSLRKILVSPVIRDEKKKGIILEVFSRNISELTTKLIDILADKSRLGLLYGITIAFETLYNDYAGILEITINTAFELNSDQIKQIVQAIETSTGKIIKHTVKVNRNLIGGVTIKYGDTVVDGSVKNKLEQLSELLQVSAT